MNSSTLRDLGPEDDVYAEIAAERRYQEERWGHSADDEFNSPNDFVAYIANYSTRWFPGGFPPYDEATLLRFRSGMVKVAALAVAATEYVDRLVARENVRPDVFASTAA